MQSSAQFSGKHVCLIISFWALSACASEPIAGPQPSVLPSTLNLKTPPAPIEALPKPSPEFTSEPISQPSTTATPTPPISDNTEKYFFYDAIRGVVFDDNGERLKNALVKVISLDPEIPFSRDTYAPEGTYVFSKVPGSIPLEIEASAAGYTTRRRKVSLIHNRYGYPYSNCFHFGKEKNQNYETECDAASFALSNKPEITRIIPNSAASGIDAKSPIILTFSEPVVRSSVESSFLISSFHQISLSIDQNTTFAPSVGLSEAGYIHPGTPIWNIQAFDTNWKSDNTEVTLSFKPGFALPTDKDVEKLPTYRISFDGNDLGIQDIEGNRQSFPPFRSSQDAQAQMYFFGVRPDHTSPQLTEIIVEDQKTSEPKQDESIKIRFSEPMMLDTLGVTLAGGINGKSEQAVAVVNTKGLQISAEQAAANYRISLIRNGETWFKQMRWSEMMGKAEFDSDDPTHSTIRLLPHTSLADTHPKTYMVTNAGLLIERTYRLRITYVDNTSDVISGSGTYTSYAAFSEGISKKSFDNIPNTGLVFQKHLEPNAQIQEKDQMVCYLISGTQRNSKPVKAITFLPDTNLEESLGIPDNTTLYALHHPNGASNLYQSGDMLQIEAATTLVDPAGNQINPQKSQISKIVF